MKIHEIIEQEQPVEQPSPQEIAAVQDLLGTIDVTKEKPQSLLNKLTGWMSAHPALDVITNMIPQTRLVKAIAAAVDALEAGNTMAALNSLAGGLTGPVGRAVKTAATVANVAQAAAQGGTALDVAQAAGGRVGRAAGAVNTMAQGGTLSQAAQAYGGAPAALARGAELAKTLMPPDDELTAIKRNAGLAAQSSPG